jgi:hypothetical protein
MLHPPSSLVALGATLLGARSVRRMRSSGWALDAQRRHAATLQRFFSRTAYGRAQGIETGMSGQVWRERVPLVTYEALAPQIARMRRGESDVLWPGRCLRYVVSSGTVSGRAKHLPLTDEMLGHFRRAGLDSLLFYSSRFGTGIFRGKHLLLGGSGSLSPVLEAKEAPAFDCDAGGVAALTLPTWARERLLEPDEATGRVADWPAKIGAVARRCVGLDIRLLAGIPTWLLVLATAVLEEKGRRDGTRPRTLREVWPGLECVVHGGVPVGPFGAELRTLCGSGINFHEVYPAAEGFVAAQDAEPEAGLRLLADAGIYYEFLPVSDYDEARLSQLGTRALPLESVRPGVDYVLVMSTPGGLARYVPGDLVRFVSTEPARLVYAGRSSLRLDVFGERMAEKELTDALSSVCQRHGWQVVNFHVAPRSSGSLTGRKQGCHEWWLELRAGSEINPTGPVIATLIDEELRRLSEDYDARRKSGGLLPPTVRLVMPGVFEQWQRAQGRWGGLHRIPRSRPDRQVAEELAKYSPFHDAV